MRRALLLVPALVAAGAALVACTSSGTTPPAPTITRTQTFTSPPAPSATAQVSTGPTTTATATSCPLVAQESVRSTIGMRLDRITVQKSGGKVVGCRLYALQTGSLHTTENLPPANQPAVQIRSWTYPSDVAAHNAFVLIARAGANPQQEQVAPGNTGVCVQTAFYPADKGKDWSCLFSVGKVAVQVDTVVTYPASNAAEVAQLVAKAF